MIGVIAQLLALMLVPEPTGRIVDQAQVITPTDDVTIQQRIVELEERTGGELAVLTVPTVDQGSPKEFATKVFNAWGVGKAGSNNGVLLLVSIGDRRVEIETGYGTEATLTDARAGAILDRFVVPRFKVGDHSGGIREGVKAIASTLEGDPEFIALLDRQTSAPPRHESRSQRPTNPLVWLFGGIFGLIVALVAAFGGRHAFWTKAVMWLALLPAGISGVLAVEPMSRLGLMALLTLFMVWLWQAFRFRIGLLHCPRCEKRSAHRTRTTIVAATYTSGGSDRIRIHCDDCSYTSSHVVSTSRLTRSNSSTSSSSSWSSSSSSSSSFGGGSSGGGGAGRSW